MHTKRQKLLEEDISTLIDFLISDQPLQTRHVRAVAPAILRKWLIDGNLNLLANELGVKFELPTLDTSTIFSELSKNPSAHFFMAGGVTLGGIPTKWIYVSDKEFSGTPEISTETNTILLTLGQFINSKKVFFENKYFTIEQIIQFASNKYGGVHYDEKRNKDWHTNLENANKYCTFGNPNHEKESKLIELTDQPNGNFMIIIPKEVGNTWGCIDIEILSIAQSFINIHCNGQRLLQLEEQT